MRRRRLLGPPNAGEERRFAQPTIFILAGCFTRFTCLTCVTCVTCLTCFTCCTALAACCLVVLTLLTCFLVVDFWASAFAGWPVLIGALLMVAGAVPCASAGPAIRLTATTAAASVLSMVIILFSIGLPQTRVGFRPTGRGRSLRSRMRGRD